MLFNFTSTKITMKFISAIMCFMMLQSAIRHDHKKIIIITEHGGIIISKNEDGRESINISLYM
jgi:hypothetical protein